MSYLSEYRNFLLKPKLKYKSVILALDGKILLDTDDRQYISNTIHSDIIKNLNKDKVFMKPIYTDKYHSKLLVSVPVLSDVDKNLIGVFCAYFDIDEIGLKFLNYEVGKNRYTYIVDLNSIILYHPDLERIGTKVENELLNSLIERINNGEKIDEYSGIYEYRGNKKFMALKYMKSTGWLIVVAQDLEEILSVSRNITILSLLLLITFLVLSIRFGIRFSETITTPLTNLMNAMKATEEGTLEHQFIYNGKDEFGSLSKAYNSMINRLKNNYDELEALYEELAATEEELRVQYDNLINSEEQLRISEERYRIALEAGKNGIFEWNTKDDILYLSEQFKTLIGYDFKEIKIRELIDEIVLEEDKDVLYSAYKDHIEGRRSCIECEIRVKTGFGIIRWMYIKGRAINLKGEEKIISGAMMDITERKEYEDNIKYLAYYDTLTDLPNRRYFIEELEKEIRNINHKRFAVLLLDLDNFKKVNDTLGHDKGDALLRKVATILKRYINNNVLVARFGEMNF
ncbi:diguanylate cyclase [Caloramator sp. mosi_1]|nr:diguanylate cyclase [Caloramator sp. mosi_1]WDC84644.1 diguanylate cyclase [Caloramator sp. mosi_1]